MKMEKIPMKDDLQLQPVTEGEMQAIEGGYDENNWCGTRYPHGPRPGVWNFLNANVLQVSSQPMAR
jgi:hypothetical protein